MSTGLNSSIKIRMYRQGLGDCFLLTFKENHRDDFNMLIDCGLLQNTTYGKEIMQQVVADIEASLKPGKTGATKKWLDVVVLTHEHADHISGFTQAKDIFDRIDFGEVWAAWMDDEGHPKYKLIRERFHKQLNGLQAALARMSPEQADLKAAVGFLVGDFFDKGLTGATGTKVKRSSPWEYALSKSTQPAKFFTPGTTFTLPGFKDIRVYILGPSEDFESFTKVNPPDDDTYRDEGHAFALMDSFFAAVGGVDDDAFATELSQPFELRFRINSDTAKQDKFFQDHYGFGAAAPDSWRQINEDWLSVAGGLALNLDSYTNNTCLAFAIEFISSGKVLLFPGDAQFSNWMSWQKVTWEVPDSNGTKQKITAKDLLARTVFYKVGHHGSHNATLKKHGLEMMTSPDLVAMIPVDREEAKKKTSKTNPKGWQMPEENLYNRLSEKARNRVVLADELLPALKKRCKDKSFLSNVKLAGTLVRTPNAAPEPLYVELTIKG